VAQKEELRVILASPGDVKPEREVARAVIEAMNIGWNDKVGVRLDPVMWERNSRAGLHKGGAQGRIDEDVDFDRADVVVGIFWHRVGTPTSDGATGTVHEIQQAWNRWFRHGRPEVMLYFKSAAYSPNGTDDLQQWLGVQEFKDSLPPEQMWWEFESTEDFRELIQAHLERFVIQRTEAPAAPDRGARPIVPRSLARLASTGGEQWHRFEAPDGWPVLVSVRSPEELRMGGADAVAIAADVAVAGTVVGGELHIAWVDRLQHAVARWPHPVAIGDGPDVSSSKLLALATRGDDGIVAIVADDQSSWSVRARLGDTKAISRRLGPSASHAAFYRGRARLLVDGIIRDQDVISQARGAGDILAFDISGRVGGEVEALLRREGSVVHASVRSLDGEAMNLLAEAAVGVDAADLAIVRELNLDFRPSALVVGGNDTQIRWSYGAT
jgi:hypothetical protein